MSGNWGVVIPGLAMHRLEMPAVPGLIALQNPEVDDGVALSEQYSLYDVAKHHLATILELSRIGTLPADGFTIAGMSMGGMINSILASKFRRELPPNVRFLFLVTTPNLKTNPAIPDALLASWLKAKPGSVEDFARILGPFFSPGFLSAQPGITASYFRYRANGENGQSPRAFFRQMTALRRFDGSETFPFITSEECLFVGGAEDEILGPSHNLDLRNLAPAAKHVEVKGLGHMINLEMPKFFALRSFDDV